MNSELATVRFAPDGDLSVATIDGEIDESNNADVWDRLAPALSVPGPLVVDLSGVSYLSSAGVRLVVDVLQHRRERGGTHLVVPSGAAPRRLLELTAIDRLTPLHEDLSTATAVARQG